jgi:light-regulated signal transduction histidine kinase (bacteriophytochrome)
LTSFPVEKVDSVVWTGTPDIPPQERDALGKRLSPRSA